MARRWTWIVPVVILGGIGLVISFVAGLWVYMSVTATPLHPKPGEVPSVADVKPGPQWTDAVAQGRHIARAGLTGQNLPGLSVAVGVDGAIVWAEGFGWADLENRVRVTPDMRFRIGTASTALTSAGVGLLLEKDRLKLDEAIQAYVPEYPKKPWPVTLRQLMGHVAGVENDGGDEATLLGKHCDRLADALPAFAEDSLLFEPGLRSRYSSYGWILVSAAVEKAADEPFMPFMRERVFEPLGMDDTIPDSATEPIRDRVTPYFPRFAADPHYGLDLMRDLDYSCYAGASAFLSTPSDLVRFAMGINGGTLLQPATVQLLQTTQRLASGQETGYGLGWDLETVAVSGKQTRVVGEDGRVLGGMAASFLTLPEHGIAVSVTSNTSYADTHALALTIAQTFAERGRVPAPK